MRCTSCGHVDTYHSQFCMNCGKPLPARGKKRALLIACACAAVAVLLLAALLSSNPVAGRWYAPSGKQLLLLQNGKGMAVSQAGEVQRTPFMYAIEYREAGYIEGEIYIKGSGESMWFYLYDGMLELDGEYYYRQKPLSMLP